MNSLKTEKNSRVRSILILGYILTVLLIAGLARGSAPISDVAPSHLTTGAFDFRIGSKAEQAQAEAVFVPTLETKFAPLQ